MSGTPFIEALSSDPYVRNLHRAAVRLLNDPTLDRGQRVKHIQRLQHQLLAHQARVAAAATAERRNEVAARTSPDSARMVAEHSQVKARRWELRQDHQRCWRLIRSSPLQSRQPTTLRWSAAIGPC